MNPAFLLLATLLFAQAGPPPWEDLALQRLNSWLGSSGLGAARLQVLATPAAPDGGVTVQAEGLPRPELVKALAGLAGGFGGPDPVTALEFSSQPGDDQLVRASISFRRRLPSDTREPITQAVQLMMRAFKVPGELRRSACMGAQFSAAGESQESLWFEGLALTLSGPRQVELHLILPPGLKDLESCSKTVQALGDKCDSVEFRPGPSPQQGPRAGRALVTVRFRDQCEGRGAKAGR